MNSSSSILLKYWGYTQFRPLQEEIIQSVLDKKDTLALLPTGGGKSICYQVPTMVMDGLCIVVSPLISLIKDQVEGLRARGIIAVSIHSGMHAREIDIALDYCVYGKPKFLFLSPERLETELFKTRVRKMKVCLLAIDEAHCISQWGYDFRPSYLNISAIRELLPNTPVLALTATATKKVVEDIKDKLSFKQYKVFFQSFERNNLIYVCRKTDNKLNELVNICSKLKGTGIIYSRSRRRTQELASELQKNNISSAFYHAGLSNVEREKVQNAWKKNSIRIISATNAFGMGIDKPDVRFVIHFDIPDSPEAYYQEAGRAGRDQNMAYAIVLYNQNDIEELKYFHEISFPDKDLIRRIYVSLGNYYKLAVGSGQGESFAFEIEKFCKIYPFKAIEVFSALHILELDGYIALSDAVFAPSRAKFEVSNFELYNFQIKNNSYDAFTKLLLRKYPGIFDEFVKIKEADLANTLNQSLNHIKQKLIELNTIGILKYVEQTDLPFITFTLPRIVDRDFKISKTTYDVRKENSFKKMSAMQNYVLKQDECRNISLLNYFDEEIEQRCGKCDICITLNKLEISNIEFDKTVNAILQLLNTGPKTLQEIQSSALLLHNEHLAKVIDWMAENDKLKLDGNNLSLA